MKHKKQSRVIQESDLPTPKKKEKLLKLQQQPVTLTKESKGWIVVSQMDEKEKLLVKVDFLIY